MRMRHVLVAFLLINAAFAELPDAPQPHPHQAPAVRFKTMVRTGEKVSNYSVPIPHTGSRIQMNFDSFNGPSFPHAGIIRTRRRSFSIGFAIRLP